MISTSNNASNVCRGKFDTWLIKNVLIEEERWIKGVWRANQTGTNETAHLPILGKVAE